MKTLLIVMTLFTVGVGGIGSRIYRARQNRERVAAVADAVVAIEESGGEVTSEYENLRSQTWLETQFDDPGDADDPVGVLTVTKVVFYHANITDAGLEHLKGLTKLEYLSLTGTNATDDGLEHLKGLTRLKVLLITGNFTDAGLEHLKGLTNLEVLSLHYNNVSAHQNQG